MPCRQEKTEIADKDGASHSYFCIQKPAFDGELLKFEIIAMLGPSLKVLRTDVDKSEAFTIFGNAISEVFKNSEPRKIMTFLRSLILGMTRDGERITEHNFDAFYTDNMIEFYKAVFFMLRVNFENFFHGANLPKLFTTIARNMENPE